jgi:hypothetical protein
VNGCAALSIPDARGVTFTAENPVVKRPHQIAVKRTDAVVGSFRSNSLPTMRSAGYSGYFLYRAE